MFITSEYFILLIEELMPCCFDIILLIHVGFSQNFQMFGPHDIVIHMRCLGAHYPPPSKSI